LQMMAINTVYVKIPVFNSLVIVLFL